MTNNELYHHGVKGMKWGQRKAAKKEEKISLKAKKRGWSDDATEVAKIQTKKVNQMTNNELSKVNNRKTLEQKYSQLNPNVIKKGLAIAGAAVAAIGTVTALTKYGGKLIKAGKSAVQKLKEKRANTASARASKAFWKGMRNTNINTNFNDILNR